MSRVLPSCRTSPSTWVGQNGLRRPLKQGTRTHGRNQKREGHSHPQHPHGLCTKARYRSTCHEALCGLYSGLEACATRTLHHSLTLFKSLIADLGMNSLRGRQHIGWHWVAALHSRPFRRLQRDQQVRFLRLFCAMAALLPYWCERVEALGHRPGMALLLRLVLKVARRQVERQAVPCADMAI
jgi:hypothetical protein